MSVRLEKLQRIVFTEGILVQTMFAIETSFLPQPPRITTDTGKACDRYLIYRSYPIRLVYDDKAESTTNSRRCAEFVIYIPLR